MDKINLDVEWALNRVTGVLVRGGKDTGRNKEGGHGKKEAEIGMMLSQAKESQEPPGTARGRKILPLGPLEEAQPCPHLDFSPLQV